ncbi:helix-turn-helix transcriptional regulator [Argonema antarcticum]|uniref:helix-turn-helix transcriptional regulator n=1 Tax=Argonema antarcticum TaxID=2942763 RepID=UPI002011BDD0|nr:helix-turn-helix transcriptional regulator [Argonema antarcticum]MCL1474275.1 hypothetical protein [Argonema antarcticum A004/B2]
MAKRSLQASESGIQQVKLALERRQLTQKAFGEELGIAWSTISKFFNGKRIYRTIFLEICHKLSLDWQEIAGVEIAGGDETPSQLLGDVRRYAAIARDALNPRILERIERKIVGEKYITAIQRGVSNVQQRVVPIIAPAGYGKSTILGNIYDELIKAEVSWVALVLCNSLSIESTPTAEKLALALGETASGKQISIAQLVTDLTVECGRGVLLIDTLDLVLNRHLATAFTTVLRQLMDAGATVVFTCRDHEYNDFLEPPREKMAAISDTIDRYNVPTFDRAEIREAAATFFHKSQTTTPEIGYTFADRILSLSADNRPLQEITCNPLLLALLCDLFAKDGNVPADLTVSKLYQRYWHEKIAYSRIDDSHTSLLAIEKENFCLAFAKSLFQMSAEKLCESAYRDELGINFTEIVATAYDNLLSEGVIERLLSTKIHFFHQTLLEYTIAYWLTRHSAKEYRYQLLQISQSDDSTRTYWFPIIRQLLTIVDESDFEEIVNKLDINRIAAFRAIAFAATSRSEEQPLLKLLPTALARGSAYQRILYRALASASVPLQETAWNCLLTILREGDRATASSAAQTIGAMLNPWGTSLSDRLEQAINAISQRTASNDNINERSQLYGWLVDAVNPIITENIDNEALTILGKHYFKFSEGTRTTVICFHLIPGVTLTAQVELFNMIKTEPLPKRTEFKFKQELAKFLAVTLPTQIEKSPLPPTDAWLDSLHHPIQSGFDLIQAKAIGQYATTNSNLLTAILQDFITGDKKNTNNNLFALIEAISYGASHQIASALIKIDHLPSERVKSVITLLKEMNNTLDLSQRESLANWIKPIAIEHPEQWLPTLADLASDSLKVQQLVIELFSTLPEEKQSLILNKNLLILIPELWQTLSHKDANSQVNLVLVKVYRETAQTNDSDISKLIELAIKSGKKAAISAAEAIFSLSKERKLPNFKDLWDLSNSTFPGVRLNYLSSIKSQIIQWNVALQESELTEICSQFGNETEPQVIQQLCELVAIWVDLNKYVPLKVAEIIGNIPTRLSALGILEGGVAGATIDTLNVMAQLPNTSLTPLVVNWTRQLLHQIDMKRVQESKVVDLLGSVARIDSSFLPDAVNEYCPSLPTRNQRIVALAVRRVEGVDSPLLDCLLTREWTDAEVKNLILEWRGV